MPVLNESERIVAALEALADLRARGTEVIVVDGGSRDATVERADWARTMSWRRRRGGRCR